jgi:DNA repair protein RadC
MAISDWPVSERPREKFLEKGSDALSDAELLAIFLRTGVPGQSAVDLARVLLDSFGGLKPLLEASEAEFCEQRGLGPAKYIQLQAVLEIARRHMFESIQRGDVLCNPNETRRYLLAQLQSYPQEVFACLFLDNRNRIISFDKMFYGTIDGASVYPREVVRLALKRNSAAVIFAHNHPSGVAEPSRADEQITKRLKEALALVDIRVLDHIVIGDKAVSFAERGLL